MLTASCVVSDASGAVDKIKVQLAKMGPRNEGAHVYVEKWLLDESAC